MTQVLHYLFLSRTNLKQHDILAFKLDKKLMTGPYYPKISGAGCTPVMVQNCEPELSFIFADLFNMYLKGSCF